MYLKNEICLFCHFLIEKGFRIIVFDCDTNKIQNKPFPTKRLGKSIIRLLHWRRGANIWIAQKEVWRKFELN